MEQMVPTGVQLDTAWPGATAKASRGCAARLHPVARIKAAGDMCSARRITHRGAGVLAT